MSTKRGKAVARRNGTNDARNTHTTVTVMISEAVREEKNSGNETTATRMISAANLDMTETGTTIGAGISADGTTEITSNALSDIVMMKGTTEEIETSADEEEEMMKSDGFPITLFFYCQEE